MLYQLRNPYHFLWLSGDYFVDALIHYIDLCCWLKGAHPVTAQGQGGRQTVSPAQSGDTFDHHFVEFAFADGTRLFAQPGSFQAAGSRSAQVQSTIGRADLVQGRIEGPKPWRFRGYVTNPYQIEFDTFIAALRQGRPQNDIEFAATSTMTAIMGRMASYSGRMVGWEDALKSNAAGSRAVYLRHPAPGGRRQERGLSHCRARSDRGDLTEKFSDNRNRGESLEVSQLAAACLHLSFSSNMLLLLLTRGLRR